MALPNVCWPGIHAVCHRCILALIACVYVCENVCVCASNVLHLHTSEAALIPLKVNLKRCTETAVSLLTETDATNNLARPEQREGEDEKEREREREREVGRWAERGVTEREGRVKKKKKSDTDTAICVYVCAFVCGGVCLCVCMGEGERERERERGRERESATGRRGNDRDNAETV